MRAAARSSYSWTRRATASRVRRRRAREGATPRRPTSSTEHLSSASSPKERRTCCASTPLPLCCSRATDCSREHAISPPATSRSGPSSADGWPSSRASRSRWPRSTSPRGWSLSLPRRRRGGSAVGEPAADDLAVAAFWFCDRAPTALQTCHHLHGGMGVDDTYPLHRYFARVKDVARLLGGPEATLEAVPARESAERRTASSPPRSGPSRTRCAATSPGWCRATTGSR